MTTSLNKEFVLQKATFGGGCFWFTEAIFQKIRGVESVVSGYAGGQTENPTYDEVSAGQSGHAEAVQINFNPDQISYATLLEIFWHTHNPTTPNRQGADTGTQYRSIIFYHNQAQKELAEKSKQDFNSSGRYSNPVITEIAPLKSFYSAETYHQNYYQSQPTAPYCQVVIEPKLQKLIQEYRVLMKDE